MKYNILFNIPNCIGYIRLILLYCAISSPDFLAFYFVSSLLDAVDGHMARKFNQCSILGSCLDMVTDRIATIIITIKIAEFKSWVNTLLLYMLVLDILSHFLHFNASILINTSHKENTNPILKFYYKRKILFFVCALNELFMCSLYAFYSGIKLPIQLIYLLGVIYMIKNLLHFIQFIYALHILTEYEIKSLKKCK
ncbi:CDP-diacylglycerol--inositol 3-phosphatidyltransferase [Astathelohania contejeani]|uniref:CDP-diacylglycerol--inositol 3-phosphatidyltransferase n=1 Tax=Astathelohania contejeani TaxID=164912 RepID=A0ABQ7HX59_9MICR|nr:CDP-diacylglycerol--inositol 3-phosphatidyltransferase [Thelohania contejeani]